MDTSFYTVRQLADRLGVSEKHIYALVASGELQAHRVGQRAIRFIDSDIEKWLKDRSTIPVQESKVQDNGLPGAGSGS
jgi:excisionase family DNA binding protein